MSGMARPAEFRPFFAALARDRLAFPHCAQCDRFHWYPMKLCPFCRGSQIVWTGVAGLGRVFSWTVVRHDFDPALRAPYIVALVEFDDAPGVRLVTNLIDAAFGPLAIGMEVAAVFPAAGERVLFRPVR